MNDKSENRQEISFHVRAAGVVMLLTFGSKLLGFARDLILANFYGASSISDAYLVSLTIPEFVFSLVIQAISVGFIPVFVEIVHKENLLNANSFVNQVLSVLYVAGAIAVVLINLFPEFIVSLFATGFDSQTSHLTGEFIRITSFAMFFKGTTSVLSAHCNANAEYTKPAIIGIPFDLIAILSIYLSYKSNVMLLAYGVVIAYASQVFLLLPSCYKNGFRFRFDFHIFNQNIRKMFYLFLPVVIGVGANQLNILIDRNFASAAAVGGISALNYANKISNIMENVIVLSVASVMYPTFSKLAVEESFDELGDTLEQTLLEIALFMVPICVGAIVFARQFVALFFERGVFDSVAVDMTTRAMVGYSIGMVGVSFTAILTRVFYSLSNTKTPVTISVVSIMLNILFNFLFVSRLGIGGLALASSLASLCGTCLLLALVKKRITISVRRLALQCIKMLFFSLIMGWIAYQAYCLLCLVFNSVVALFFSIGIGTVVYFVFALVFRFPLISELHSRLNRKKMK